MGIDEARRNDEARRLDPAPTADRAGAGPPRRRRRPGSRRRTAPLADRSRRPACHPRSRCRSRALVRLQQALIGWQYAPIGGGRRAAVVRPAEVIHMPTLRPGPHVFALADLTGQARPNSPLSRSVRLITPETSGSNRLFAGVFWSDPGSSGGWSYRREGSFDPALPFLGELDEVYFCSSGRIHVDWDEGEFEFGANDIVFFPGGLLLPHARRRRRTGPGLLRHVPRSRLAVGPGAGDGRLQRPGRRGGHVTSAVRGRADARR